MRACRCVCRTFNSCHCVAGPFDSFYAGANTGFVFVERAVNMKHFLIVLMAAMLGALVPAYADPESTAASAQQPAMSDEDRLMDAFQNDALAPTLAPEGYDVTIVMFTDYQCGYCKKMYRSLQALMTDDQKIRLVYRDWPIFGSSSEQAARAAIASQFQGKYEAFNDALMKTTGKMDKAKIKKAAETAGVDWGRLQKDLVDNSSEISALLHRNEMQARLLGFTGTPGLLVGTYPIGGALDLENLEKVVGEPRRRNKPSSGN